MSSYHVLGYNVRVSTAHSGSNRSDVCHVCVCLTMCVCVCVMAAVSLFMPVAPRSIGKFVHRKTECSVSSEMWQWGTIIFPVPNSNNVWISIIWVIYFNPLITQLFTKTDLLKNPVSRARFYSMQHANCFKPTSFYLRVKVIGAVPLQTLPQGGLNPPCWRFIVPKARSKIWVFFTVISTLAQVMVSVDSTNIMMHMGLKG